MGRGVRLGDHVEAAVSVSMPSVRFHQDRLVEVVSALTVATRDIEHDMAAALPAA